MSRWYRVLFCLLALAFAGCQPEPPAASAPPAPKIKLSVAAAADLRLVFPKVVEAYAQAAQGVELEASFGASGALTTQIRNGAPFDVFLSADKAYPAKLAADHLTTGDPLPYARGALVIWTAKGALPDLATKGLAALRGSAVHKVSLANPEHAPYGRAAMAALESAKLTSALADKLVKAENVSQAAQWAASGAAQAGLISLSLAQAPEMAAKGEYVRVPETAYPPLVQAAVVVTTTKQAAAAEAFIKWLAGPDGANVLSQAGFGQP